MHLLTRQRITNTMIITTLLAMSLWSVGCDVAGMIGYAIAGPPKENILAQYRGLKNAHFAVLVSSDENVLFQSPEAPSAICTAVTRHLASNVPGAIAISPRKMVKFQEENPYWTTTPYDRLLDKLNVEQLVIIDVVQYQIHEKGNANVWRGTAVANVSVAQRTDFNTLSFSKIVKATYPVGSSIGSVNADEQTFRLALLQNLTSIIGHLFYDYQIIHE